MENKNFELSMSELKKIVAEEYSNLMNEAKEANSKKAKLEAKLKMINEELENLEEVEASGKEKVKSTAWTGEENGDVKFKPKFEKKGSHLLEDDELEGELEVGGEVEVEMEDEMDAGYFEAKFAELGKELDEKLSEEGEEMDSEEMADEMGVEVDAEEEMEDELEETVAEEVVAEEVAEEGESCMEGEEMEEEMISEDLEEPIEGDSVAQDQDARFNDGMEKDNHVNESTKPGSGLLSEGFTPEKKTKLSSELSRMAKLAKIGK